jgi:hypothetical protein
VKDTNSRKTQRKTINHNGSPTSDTAINDQYREMPWKNPITIVCMCIYFKYFV